ncbi:DUF4335 domain-containing protein [Myxosarcina sp. GI1(2024)]
MSSPPKVCRFTPPTCTLEINYSVRTADKSYFRLSFDDPRIPEREQVTIQGDRQQLERLDRLVFDRLQKYLSSSFVPTLKVDDLISETEIELDLRSPGLLNHQLLFKSSDKDSVSKINLTTVQLFDLTTALEAYKREITNSTLSKTSKPSKNLLVWGSCAVGAILVLGLATLEIKNTQQVEPERASSSEPQSTETIPEFERVVPPQVSKTEEPRAKPQLSEPISSAEKLPPPLPVDVPKPQPDIPDPADYPPSEPLDLSALEPPVPPSDRTESTITVLPEMTSEPQQSTSASTSQPETKSPNPNPSPAANYLVPNPEDSIASSDLDTDVTARSLDSENSNNFSETTPEAEEIPKNSQLALSSSTAQTQLQQVNQYFQEKWQPPEQLTETIEYRLVIGSEGAIARIFPIGKASEVYLDRTNIPLMGESFISPSSRGQNLTVRLMLSPDGEVATFAE